MELSKRSKSLKYLAAMTGCAACLLTACGTARPDTVDLVIFEEGVVSGSAQSGAESDPAASVFGACYEKAVRAGQTNRLEMTRAIVCGLGGSGYVAVDAENQIDMTNSAQVLQFCDAVDTGQTADLTILQIVSSREDDLLSAAAPDSALTQGFQRYDFHTENRVVDVERSFYRYCPDGSFTVEDTVQYRADFWQYTKEGYLMLSGSYFAQDYYIVSLTDAPEYAAFRTAPLDAQCRDGNRRYLQPVGYARNNLFLVSWDESDFGSLDLFDAFDQFYPMIYHRTSPYVIDENPGVGAVYQIPEAEFEQVIQTYLAIDTQTLRSMAAYLPTERAYVYRPRGLYEAECSSQPYPEVVGCAKNADKTVTLTVNAVFPYEHTAKAFSHEVTVRPLADGAFQYVSNRIVDGTYDAWWRTERLTQEEWEQIYREQIYKEQTVQRAEIPDSSAGQSAQDLDESLWYLPHADDCLLAETERKDIETAVLTAAGQVRSVYQDLETQQGASYASNVRAFSARQCKQVVELLGKAGYTSIADDVNMENPDKVRSFYEAYTQGRDAAVTVYKIHSDGLIGAVTFLHRAGRLQTYYVGVGWQQGGAPYIKNTLVSDVSEMTMTPRGYLIYTYQDAIVHSDASQYMRIEPLSDKCRELTANYIYGISFANYSAFVTDWDSSNVEEILEPCLFEDIYHIYTGNHIYAENDRIPAAEYEQIMMTCFPVTREQLRRTCGYDAGSDSYPYEMIFAVPHAPFGEVVDYAEHADGTLTLTVDGVWIDYQTDCAFTSRIRIQPFADGTFRYLSNEIVSGREGAFLAGTSTTNIK